MFRCATSCLQHRMCSYKTFLTIFHGCSLAMVHTKDYHVHKFAIFVCFNINSVLHGTHKRLSCSERESGREETREMMGCMWRWVRRHFKYISWLFFVCVNLFIMTIKCPLSTLFWFTKY